jgi:HAD superfamily phosphoserine phosphatase-like hydrolase
MRTAVFFSLEGPLLRGEVQFSFIRWAALRGDLAPSSFRRGLLNYLQHRLRIVRSAEGPGADGFTLLRGCSAPRIESAAAEYFARRLIRRLRRQAAATVAAHRRRGHVTVLVTPAATVVARPIARFLQIDVLLATQLEVSGQEFTGRCLTRQACGAEKRLVVQDYCARFGADLARSYAYSSAQTDGSLLAAVGHPIAAHPDRLLREQARAQGWPIIDLDAAEPVLAG